MTPQELAAMYEIEFNIKLATLIQTYRNTGRLPKERIVAVMEDQIATVERGRAREHHTYPSSRE